MKKIIIPIIILFILIEGMVLIHNHNIGTNPEQLCRASGGGWAPAFFGDNDGPPDANGNPITPDSQLVDRSRDRSGYTCYCHIENTGWDGKACVPIQK